jgi:copper homeostasis protein
MNKLNLEACVENLQQCIKSQELGAHRVELCADLKSAGTTPSYGLVKKCKELIKIPVFVIIRPRGGDFVYDRNEIEIMRNDIEILINLNVDGFVFGILTEHNEVDYDNCKYLIDFVKSFEKDGNKFSLTFHMAFDSIREESKLETIDKIISLGFSRILTKGSLTNATDGIKNLIKYNEYANGKIIIMPGGGVTKDNYSTIAEYTGCLEFHGTKIVGPLN